MTTMTRIGINGFGRMGRLAMRAGWDRPGLEFAAVNEIEGGAAAAAHLLTFDSVHGRWAPDVEADDGAIRVDGSAVGFTAEPSVGDGPWDDLDVVLECTGRFKTRESLQPYFDRGVQEGHRRRAGQAGRPQRRRWSERPPLRPR